MSAHDELPGRLPYVVTDESRFNDPDAVPFLGFHINHVFLNKEVFRVKVDTFSGAAVGERVLVAACATQDAALAAQRLLNMEPVRVEPVRLRLVTR
jgi:hypothetical protein